jgi:hypothetical protein
MRVYEVALMQADLLIIITYGSKGIPNNNNINYI